MTLAIIADFSFMASGYRVTLGKAFPPYKIVFSFPTPKKMITLFLISDHLGHDESSLLPLSSCTLYIVLATYATILFFV